MKSDVDNTQCDIHGPENTALQYTIGYYWILLLTIRMCAVQKDDKIVVGELESSSLLLIPRHNFPKNDAYAQRQ